VVYAYTRDRKGERPAQHLRDFRGVLQVDGYAGFERLAGGNQVVLAACWSHARRRFYDLAQSGSPIAAEALRRFAQLYAIEDRIRGHSAEERRQVRQTDAAPRVAELKGWLEQELRRLPGRSKLAEAIRYAVGRWPVLCVYLDDGRVEMDTNVVERAIRPVAEAGHPLVGRGDRCVAEPDGQCAPGREKPGPGTVSARCAGSMASMPVGRLIKTASG